MKRPRAPRRATSLAPAALLAALLLAAAPAGAGTVLLLNGEIIHGEIVDVTTLEVAIKAGGGVLRIPISQVKDIRLDTGESVHSHLVDEALAAIREELRAEAEDRRRLRLGLPAPPPDPPPAPPEPAAPASADEAPFTLAATYASAIFGFKLGYPAGWRAAQEASDYFTFQAAGAGAGGRPWSYNLTVFEPFETTYDDLVRKAALELGSHEGLRVVRRRTAAVAGVRAERTTTAFERGDLRVRHEQVVVEARAGRVLVLHFFVPGGDLGTIPEIEAVLASLELKP